MSKRIDLLKNFWDIITSDGEIHPREEKFFLKIARFLGYKLDNIEDITLLDEIKVSSNTPLSYQERIDNIYGLALMIKIDGKIHKKEIDTIRNIGIKMGLPVEALNNMLEILFEREKKYLKPEELKKIFDIPRN